jgi:hypothetical protein
MSSPRRSLARAVYWSGVEQHRHGAAAEDLRIVVPDLVIALRESAAPVDAPTKVERSASVYKVGCDAPTRSTLMDTLAGDLART